MEQLKGGHVTGQGVHSVNTMFILGFRFCFESPSTFSVQAGFISLLSVSGCE
jgi:hypothetical protein